MKDMPIALPTIKEQQRIVAMVDRRLSVADEIKKELDQAFTRAERLRHSILKKAFEGKLVPQNQKDEPAEFLLKKIRKIRQSDQISDM